MKVTRGLHPETMPQRAGKPDHWTVPQPDAEHVELTDAPMPAVAKGIAWIVTALVMIVGAVLIFTSAIKSRTPLMADNAARAFHAPAPQLQVAAPAARAALERAHRAPSDAAMDQVVKQGWGDTAPAPGRANVAMGRAGAAQ